MIKQIEELNLNSKDYVITKKPKQEKSIGNNDQITRVALHFKNVGLKEYTINNMMFNVLSLHDVGCPSESPLAIGTLIPLDPSDNQMCFMYASTDYPSYKVLKTISQ